MASTSKDRIEIGDGFTAEVSICNSRSPHLVDWFRVDEKTFKDDGTTATFAQIVMNQDGEVHHVHLKYPHNEEKYYGPNSETVMIIKNGEIVFQRT